MSSETFKKELAPKDVQLFDEKGEPVKDSDGLPVFLNPESQEVHNKYILVRDPVTNEMFAYPNPELAEIGPTELATFFAMTEAFAKAQRDGFGASYKGFGFPHDPRGISRGWHGPSQQNATWAWPPLSSALE